MMLRMIHTIILFGLTALAASNTVTQPLAFSTAIQLRSNISISQTAVPFGTSDGANKFSEPSLVQTAESEFDPANIADDSAWEKYAKKGQWYACLMDMTIEQAGKALRDTRTPPSAESKWQGDLRSDILKWGWYEAFYDPTVSCDFRDGVGLDSKNKIGSALTALGLSLLPLGEGGDNECFSVEHFDETLVDEDENEVPIGDQSYRVGDTEYPFTGAHYRFAINKKGGAIFAQGLQKPATAAVENLGGDILDESLPQLSRASDIMWSYWVRNNPEPRNLYHYFVNHVRNEETNPLIARILRNHGMDRVPYWPGLQLEMGEGEAEIILGSPMGSTIAHLLFQHKASLGIKRLESIVIFRDNFPERLENAPSVILHPEVQILFKIVDVPLKDLIDEDLDMPDAKGLNEGRWVQVHGESSENIVREHNFVVRLDGI